MASNTDFLLALESVGVSFDGFKAVDDLNLYIDYGELRVIIGPNGAGKTTSISAIMGLVAPRNGTVSLFGETISGLPPEAISRTGVGLVPQGRRIFPSLTVKENLVIARQRESDDPKSWNLQRIFNLFPRLEERQQQLAGSLSGGEQQMLALGRALMGNPRVLLLDEPTASLDPDTADWVRSRLERYRADTGATILLASHNMNEVERLCERVIIMKKGRIEDDDTPARLLARYSRETLEEVFLDVARGRDRQSEATR